ncbi:MAG: hypothetical protein HZA93_17720 [Verrucomicrobia bacterium]|nr:hypothetical protein [Verrucomicrobiota bacterium]
MNAFTFEFPSGEHILLGLFVDRPSLVSYEELADELYNSRRSDLTVVNVLVIRPPVDEALPPEESAAAQLAPVLERVPHLPLHLLGSVDFSHRLTTNLNPSVPSILVSEGNGEFIARIRQVELEHYVTEANAILRTSGARIFRAPSGKYCRSFLRVGNVQTNRAAIDGFFFWLLPWLKDCRAIVTETWTISTIAMNTARLLARYSPVTHARVNVEMLSQYHQRGSLLPDTETVLRHALSAKEGNALILISSSMSGTLIDGIEAAIREIGLSLSRFRFGSLYLLGPAKTVPHLCDLSKGVHGATFEFFETPPPDAGDSPAIIEIDRRTYFPLRVVCAAVDVRKATAAAVTDFINAYRNTDLLSVHRDSFLSNGQRHRHHAIYTDLRKVIDHSRFTERLREKLSDVVACPKVIISPPHAAGEALAKRVQDNLAERFGRMVPTFQHIDLQLQESDASDRVLTDLLRGTKEEESIIVVDDVSVTGGRLSRFQTSLRQPELGFDGRIHYLVGIARPARRADWEARMMRLRFRAPKHLPQHTVSHVEFVVLPDWQEKECPWCQEQDLIRLLARARRASPACVARGHRLHAAVRDDPMMGDLFFMPEGMAAMRLTKNSILIDEPASQADVFCVVASTLQTMRTTDVPGKTLVSHFPEIHVLDPQCAFGNHFNDSVLRAAVLRGAKARELEYPDAEQESARRQLAAAVIIDPRPDMHDLGFEIGVAMALHKLPSILSESGVEDVVQERGWKSAFSDFEASAKGRL